jgi:hypothetical protein
MSQELIPIERKEGVTLYGRIVDGRNKLGQYEVHSDVLGYDGIVYPLYKDAERRMSALIGFHNNMTKAK